MIVGFFLLFIIVLILDNPLLYDFDKKSYSQTTNDTKTPVTASGWNFNSLVIDDTGGGNYTWAEAELQPWCNGSGTWDDPYTLNLTINSTGSLPCLQIKNSNKFFLIENCTFIKGTYAIDLYQISNGTIDRNTFMNNTDGIYLKSCNNITIQNISLTFNYSSSNGIYTQTCNNLIIKNCTIINARYCINLDYTNYTLVSDNIIIGANLPSWTTPCSWRGINVRDSKHSNITNNRIINVFEGISCSDSYNIIFTKNNMTNTSLWVTQNNTVDTSNLANGKPIYYYENQTGLRPYNFTNAGQVILFDCNNSIISNVEISYVFSAITDAYCFNSTISNCSVNEAWQNPIGIVGNNGTIVNCIVSNAQNFPLTIQGNYNKLVNNTSFSNKYDGFYVLGMNNTISYNRAIDNPRYGLFSTSSSGSFYYRNEFIKNEIGIYLDTFSNFNEIFENYFYQNSQFGIHITSSSNNVIYGNAFIQNGIHARDDGTNNQWDNGITGNYWDNYTGTDPDKNGIGNTPYMINGSAGSQDGYPLMEIPEYFNGGGDGPDGLSHPSIPSLVDVIFFSVCLIAIVYVISKLKYRKIT
jgi:parallel beta-helix repeat protein